MQKKNFNYIGSKNSYTKYVRIIKNISIIVTADT